MPRQGCGGMLRLAVLGHPVAHSRSPQIHARFARDAGIAIRYDRIDCPAGELAQTLSRFRAAGGHGCNLTAPLKTEGLALARSMSEAARAAGAANTLVWREGGWFADNTDGAGLVADFDRLGIELTGRSVLVIGAGGAAAGVLPSILERAPARLTVLNRNPERAAQLASRYRGGAVIVESAGLDEGPMEWGFDLLLQATSLGHEGRVPFLRRDWLAPDAVAYDLNYGAAARPFLRWCEQTGLSAHEGLGMLIEQAAEAFARFTGLRPSTTAMHRSGIGR